MTVAYVVAGPERHGVVLHGLRLAQASAGLAASLVRLPSPSLGEPAALTAELLAPHDRVMVQVTDRLFGDDLWTPAGIRTHSSADPHFDPDSYHLGSVWPHDNAIIAAGIKRLGISAALNKSLAIG